MIEVFQALLTPVIAIITTLIAYQQYRIRKDERALAMYDRRLRIYNQIVEVVHKVRSSQPMCTEDADDWVHSVAEADFLFGPEVKTLIGAIYRCILEWVHLTEGYKVRGDEMIPSLNEESLKCADVVYKFESFNRPIEQVFRPYLHPYGAPFWKRRKSERQLLIILKQHGFDVEQKRGRLSQADDGESDEDIPF